MGSPPPEMDTLAGIGTGAAVDEDGKYGLWDAGKAAGAGCVRSVLVEMGESGDVWSEGARGDGRFREDSAGGRPRTLALGVAVDPPTPAPVPFVLGVPDVDDAGLEVLVNVREARSGSSSDLRRRLVSLPAPGEGARSRWVVLGLGVAATGCRFVGEDWPLPMVEGGVLDEGSRGRC